MRGSTTSRSTTKCCSTCARCSRSPDSTRPAPSSPTCSTTWLSIRSIAGGCVDDPEIIPLAVEETLRYYTIIFGDGRKVTRDVEFHGVQLKKGDMVYGLVSGANRDPRHWEQADEFVIDRKRNNHFGFASGPHRCLGMHLARREMAIAVDEWLKVIPDFELATDAQLIGARRWRDDVAEHAAAALGGEVVKLRSATHARATGAATRSPRSS